MYRAFQLIAAQPPNAVPLTPSGDGVPTLTRPGSATAGTVDATVAVSVSGNTTTVVALVTNYNTPGNPISNVTVTLAFSGVMAPPSSATVSLIDDNHAYARPVWVAAGSPTYPNASEVAAELAASKLVPFQSRLLPAGPGSYALPLTLLPNAVAQVVFTF